MLSYSLNEIMILGVILWEKAVNAGHKSICVKVTPRVTPPWRRRENRGHNQDNLCYLPVKFVKGSIK